MTKYDSLEELSAEVKLKHLLWDSLEEWDKLQNSWMQVHTYMQSLTDGYTTVHRRAPNPPALKSVIKR